jgi:hypothetical protein
MYSLFSVTSWNELLHDTSFWNAVTVLILVSTGLFAMLYSDNIQRWRAQRQERLKWYHWNG